MAARSIWNGTLKLGRTAIPVKLYAAVEDRAVRFHLLHDRDEQRLKQRMVHGVSGDDVPREEVRRGYEVEPGMFVVLDEAELASVAPTDDTHEIEITRFVDPAHVDQAWYDRPYWLGPNGSSREYFALAEALGQAGREGIARWVMRKRHHAGALRAHGDHLVLVTLRHAGEVVERSEMPAPPGREPTANERAMAIQLVSMLEGELDLAAFRDEYRERVLALVEAKAKGRTFTFERAKRERRPEELEQALAASLTRARKERKIA